MKIRKLILIIANLILLTVCIIQGIFKARDGIKYFELKQHPDEIIITTPAESVHLVWENENWYLGEQKYPANNVYVQNLVDALVYIRALDKVASVNENTLNKYELVDGKKISVQASKEGKILRSIDIGKEATANSHSYIIVDNKNDIFTASGTLRSIFNKTAEELRSSVVWELEKSKISSAAITFADGKNWSVTKNSTDTEISWNIYGDETNGIEIDYEKVAQMFDNAAMLVASSWYDDNTKIQNLDGEFLLSSKIGYDGKTVSLEIYEIKPKITENDNSQQESVYYATSSETPYIFKLESYSVDKFNKKPQDIAK